MTQESPPAGWYEDAEGATRWWDGTAWTARTHDLGATTVAGPGPGTAVVAEPVQTLTAQPTSGRHSVAAAPAQTAAPPRQKGTGLYREFSARTTGILMVVAAVPVLGLRIVTFVTGAGHFSVGSMLWTAGGVALLVGGLNRLRASGSTSTEVVASPSPAYAPFGGMATEAVAPAARRDSSYSTPPAPPPASEADGRTSSWPQPSSHETLPGSAYTGYSTTQKRSGHVGVGSRGWVLAVLGLIAVLLVAYGFVASRPSSSTAAAGPAAVPTATAPAADARWAPKGYKQVPGGLAWKKAATTSKDCKVDTACVRVSVMTKARCALVRLEVTFGDAGRSPLDTQVAYTKKYTAEKPKVVRVSSTNVDQARYAAVTSLRCMDIT